MKILHILGTDRLSGAENVHLDILRALKADNDVVYCSPDGPIRSHVEAAGVRFRACDTEDPSVIRELYEKERPDVVHACDPRMSFKCARAGIPFISHLHNNCPWMKKYSPNSFALRYAVKKADAVIAVSQSIPDSYVFKKAFEDKLYVVPNVVNREKVTLMAEKPFDREYDLLFVGRFTDQKRPLLFLEIVRALTERIPHLKAAMVGEGELYGDAEKYISDNGMKNVDLLGFDPNPYKIMARSKLVVFTSYYEGFGLVAVEGMILSKPVVAFPAGGITSIAENGGALCADKDEMISVIEDILTDGEKYARLSEKASAASFAYTDTDSYISEIKRIYASSACKR